ncbi:MAG: thiamine pyrophosphate-binding protein [Candidatus Omnitrophota bacterium]
MIKLTDYITKRLVEYGVKDVFMISGGGAMHLVDSVGRQKGLRYICPHHEQAAAIASEGYSRVSGKIGVAVVTSGPGGTNTLTGVIGQWLDSVPALYLSGQVKIETTISACPEIKLRQLGDQEINIVDIVKPVTKYAVMVTDPAKIRYHLEKAVYLATHDRPGPVWLDIPLNIQAAMIDENKLESYVPENGDTVCSDIRNCVRESVEALRKAKRPLIIAGNGIRLGNALKEFEDVIRVLKVPVVTSFNGFDLMETNDPLFVGRIGTIGNRAANFALQNADLLISIGSRNNIRQISYNWAAYARNAKKIIVDIDEAELKKPTIRPDIAINCDSKEFLKVFEGALKGVNLPSWDGWKDWCMVRKKNYPAVDPSAKNTKKNVDPYYFIDVLTDCLQKNAIVVTGNGTASVVYFQAGKVKKGQRVIWNSGCASMGYDLPAAIGAAIAGKRDVVCIAGDGSLQMNLQELQTLANLGLPVKLFVLNNAGYISIRQTQDSLFDGNHVGSSEKSGVTLPDILKIAAAYGLNHCLIDKHERLKERINTVLKTKGPVVCEVKLLNDYIFSPKLSSQRMPDGTLVSKPLEDMYPFLDREEFNNNMITKG